MAEPVSFAASVIAIATLAGNIATKGYRYLRAIKDCPDEVRKLMAEVNVLCGILDRLAILLQSKHTTPRAPEIPTSGAKHDLGHENVNDIEEAASSDSEDGWEPSVKSLETPSFIYECQRTLEEIESILHKFGRPGAPPSGRSSKTPRFSLSALRRLDPKDLLWPLSKSKTLQLIQTLERLKSTCTIALAESEMIGIHRVLVEAEICNSYLARIHDKQEKILEIQLNLEEEKVLAWLSPVNAAVKHQAFKRERQPGTGMWLFDLPDMVNWLDDPNDALWIYGIPGAGKTMLSTLVVDEVLTYKRSNTPVFIKIREAQSAVWFLAGTSRTLETTSLKRNFHTVSIAATSADLRLFTNAWLGRLDIQSETLRIEVVDTLVNESNGMFMWVRAQVDYLRRLPNDLEKRRALKQLPPDLPRTYIRIFETIHRTYPPQTIKYIQRILKWLVCLDSRDDDAPPYAPRADEPTLSVDQLCQAICVQNETDWPTTDIVPTREQVLRWLGCLVRWDRECNTIHLSHFTIKEFLSMDPRTISSSIAQGFLVEPNVESYIANVCLTYILHQRFKCSVDTSDEIEAFLSDNPFYKYVADALVRHLQYSNDAEGDRLLRQFLAEPPVSAFKLWERCHVWTHCEWEGWHQSLHYFPSPLHFASATGLVNHMERLLSAGADPDAAVTMNGFYITPLHIALSISATGHFELGGPALYMYHSGSKRKIYSSRMIRILIKSGADVNRQVPLNLLPLNLYSPGTLGMRCIATPLIVAVYCETWDIARLLLDAGAKSDGSPYIDMSGFIDLCSVKRLFDTLPLYEDIVQHAISLGGHGELADQLEEWISVRNQSNQSSSCSESAYPSMSAREGFQDNSANVFSDRKISRDKPIPRSGPMCPFMGICEPVQDTSVDASLELKVSENMRFSGSGSVNSQIGIREDFQGGFVNAFSEGKWQEARRLHTLHPELDVNRADNNGWCAIHYASQRTDDVLEILLEHGASPNITSSNHNTALCIASQGGYVVNLRLLLKFGADTEYRGSGGWTPVLASINWRQVSSLEALLDWGADINAKLDNGRGAMHIAIEVRDTIIISALLERGLDTLRPDNYGTTALHLACQQGDEDLVAHLMRSKAILNKSVNINSLVCGTPLYTAACYGSSSIINLLLSYGAEINLLGSGLGSALMVACAEGHTAAVATLLSRGAALELKGSRLQSAEGTARAFRQEKVLKLLEEYGRKPRAEGEDESFEGSEVNTARDIMDLGNLTL
ncbi:MAG: hypothetical protein Q9211_001292 [Gyalolechia sp. 1 TL-2023]